MLMVQSLRSLLAAVMAPLVLAGCTRTAGPPAAGTGTADPAAGSTPAVPGAHRGLSAVRHVWVIELENQGYEQSFGTPVADPYLARTLPRMGALLKNYYAIGHSSAATTSRRSPGRGRPWPPRLTGRSGRRSDEAYAVGVPCDTAPATAARAAAR